MNIQLDRGAKDAAGKPTEEKGNTAEGAGTPTPVSGTMQKMQRTVTHVERYRKNI